MPFDRGSVKGSRDEICRLTMEVSKDHEMRYGICLCKCHGIRKEDDDEDCSKNSNYIIDR